jgi:phage terminase large subunit-like protein
VTGTERCKQFVADVLSGDLPAPLPVIQACERFRRDKDHPDIEYISDSADDAVMNIEELTHTKGRWQRQKIHLENWQCFVVCNLFGWKWKKTGLRRFRYGYLQVPRKNGKTLLAVAIGLIMFGPDQEPGAEILLGATTQDQAKDLLFKPAKYIVRTNDQFRDMFGIEINATTLVIPENDSVLKVVIKKPDDGTSPHFGLVDEFHLHGSPELARLHSDPARAQSSDEIFDQGLGERRRPRPGEARTTSLAGVRSQGELRHDQQRTVDLVNRTVHSSVLVGEQPEGRQPLFHILDIAG